MNNEHDSITSAMMKALSGKSYPYSQPTIKIKKLYGKDYFEHKISLRSMTNFVRKISGRTIKICLFPYYDNSDNRYAAFAVNNNICINGAELSKDFYTKNDILAILAHEVGHIVQNHSSRCFNDIYVEYEAQKWAYDKMLELKYDKVANILKSEIELDWNRKVLKGRSGSNKYVRSAVIWKKNHGKRSEKKTL